LACLLVFFPSTSSPVSSSVSSRLPWAWRDHTTLVYSFLYMLSRHISDLWYSNFGLVMYNMWAICCVPQYYLSGLLSWIQAKGAGDWSLARVICVNISGVGTQCDHFLIYCASPSVFCQQSHIADKVQYLTWWNFIIVTWFHRSVSKATKSEFT
jgi:hypothetical protein